MKKIHDDKGFTLVEMLAAALLLVLLCLMLSTGLNMALKSYRTMRAESETQVLLSTLTDALADDLRFARYVKADEDGKLISYDSDSYNKNAELTLNDEGQLLANNMRVLPPGAYGNGAYVVDKLYITYKDGVFTIDLTVKEAGGDISASAQTQVRCLNANARDNTAT